MQNDRFNHKTCYYRVIKTRELINSKSVWSYGIEGFSNGEAVTVKALSLDRKRIERLVRDMNESGLELNALRGVIDNFLLKL